MSQLFANNARSRLVAGISASATTLTVESATADLFPIANTPNWLTPVNWFKAVLQNALGQTEIIHVGVRTSGSGVFSNVLRGQEGTTARIWNAGDVVGLRLTALDYEGLVNIKTANNTFEGINTFTQPIVGDLQGNANTASHADTAGAATLAALANAIADGTVSTAKMVDGAATLAKLAAEVVQRLVPAGVVGQFALRAAPTGWLECNGAAVSRTTYAALYAALCPSLGNFTVTIASPAVLTLAGNNLQVGEPVRLSTTGALPTGLAANTTYFVQSKPGADTITLSATQGGAAINTSGSQSGTHSAQSFVFGAGDGSTTFNLPDLRGEFVRGLDRSRGIDAGRALGSLQLDAMQQITGQFSILDSTSGGLIVPPGAPYMTGPYGSTTGPSSGSGFLDRNSNTRNTQAVTFDTGADPGLRNAAETRPRNVALLFCIKT